MSQINVRRVREMTKNAVGTLVPQISAVRQLNRMVMASMLFEDNFYLDGQSHYDLVKQLSRTVNPEDVAKIAIRARIDMKLRHVPLVLVRELARIGKLKAETLTTIIQRPDEITEFVAHYWKDKKEPFSNQVKKGLAACFHKFTEYQLAKYNKSGKAISLRDVLFMTHAKPQSIEQEQLFKRIADDTLETPDTWEVALSTGANKRETFTRLITEHKLGALAFIRNLRGMLEAKVDESMIRKYAAVLNVDKVLPFRFIAAARIVPQLEDMLESMMFRALVNQPKLPGKTVLLVDVSGSMDQKISNKSDLTRFDAAAALAVLCRELCEEVEIYTFSYNSVRVAPRRGFALVEALDSSQPHMGTQLGTSVREVNAASAYDRIVVFTDEQSYDVPPSPKGKGYMINVATNQYGVNRKDWLEINGFSEKIFDFIKEVENTTD